MNEQAIIEHVDNLKQRSDDAAKEAQRLSELSVIEPTEYNKKMAEAWCNKEEFARAEEERAIISARTAGIMVAWGSKRGLS